MDSKGCPTTKSPDSHGSPSAVHQSSKDKNIGKTWVLTAQVGGFLSFQKIELLLVCFFFFVELCNITFFYLFFVSSS